MMRRAMRAPRKALRPPRSSGAPGTFLRPLALALALAPALLLGRATPAYPQEQQARAVERTPRRGSESTERWFREKTEKEKREHDRRVKVRTRVGAELSIPFTNHNVVLLRASTKWCIHSRLGGAKIRRRSSIATNSQSLTFTLKRAPCPSFKILNPVLRCRLASRLRSTAIRRI